jgi:isopropylmalate/homocitrate/citramalate synthase
MIDLGFPAVSREEQEGLKQLLEGKRKGELRSDFELIVMCRSNKGDIDKTLEAIAECGGSPKDVTFFIFTAGSDLHVKYKLGKTLLRREGRDESEWLDLPVQWYRDANKKMFVELIGYAKSKGVETIEVGNAEDGSRADLDYIIEMGKETLAAGGTRLSFPDTVGTFTPQAAGWYFERLVAAFPGIDQVIHFHNDFDLGTINTITAMSVGANIPTVTVNGIGERAGNAPMHSVLGALYYLYGIEIPNFKYEQLAPLSRLVQDLSGIPVQPHEPIVGSNVYAHESGIHTAGLAIDRRMYQVIDPTFFGAEMTFVFGKHTGTSAVEYAFKKYASELKAAGITPDANLIAVVTSEVKRIREERQRNNDTQAIIQRYHEDQARVGISEREVIELTKVLAAVPVAE